ncbi:stress response NST1-like protein [Tasmannia lanceolata]|uniref:stress response NST1-like protein n=1 Tax=Tasmannia lanceolata TaxID=3420 RepID=UPI00406430D5
MATLIRLTSRPPPSSQTLKSLLIPTVRSKTTSTSTPSHRHHTNPHEFSSPSEFLGSWKSPTSPKEAETKLAHLRRDYAKQVKQLRHQYFYEMELHRAEKQRKDEAKREAVRKAKEERKAAKAAAAQTRAAERKVLEDEFRQTLVKERAEKLEYWRATEEMRVQIKSEKNKLLRQQSSMWIDEKDLEKRLVEVILDTTPL